MANFIDEKIVQIKLLAQGQLPGSLINFFLLCTDDVLKKSWLNKWKWAHFITGPIKLFYVGITMPW